MTNFTEVFEVLYARIRSPIFGSIAFAFIVFNWKALYFLTFAKTTVTARIQYFDDHTTWWTTLVLPVVVGTLFAVVSPWIVLKLSVWASTPIRKLRENQIRQRDKTKTLELELEFARNKKFEERATELTEKAFERSEKTKAIEDEEIIADLRYQIAELRKSTEQLSQKPNQIDYSEIDLEIQALERKLQILKEERDAAIVAKDFSRISKLNDQIDEIIESLDNIN